MRTFSALLKSSSCWSLISVTDKLFWGLKEEIFEKVFEIKKFGPRKKLMDRIKEIKDAHKKQFDVYEKIKE